MILGVGTDVVMVEDLRRSMTRTPGFQDKVFGYSEISHCSGNEDPWPCYAARFAAKEAVMKALGTGWSDGVDFLDIVVDGSQRGNPIVVLSGVTAARVSEMKGRVHLSLSSSPGVAIAFAVVERI